MANLVAPRGFTPKRHLDGSPFNNQSQLFLIPSSDNTALFVGDVVQMGGSAGAAGLVVAGVNCEGIPTAIKAASGTTGQLNLGVVMGFLVDPTNLQLAYRVASTNRLALVCTDMTVVYEVQEDAVTRVYGPGDIGETKTFNLGSGNTTTGRSTATLVSNYTSNAATAPFKLIGLAKRTGNAFNVAGAGSDPGTFEVVMNTGYYAPNVVGV
jgi:hypothetical protein